MPLTTDDLRPKIDGNAEHLASRRNRDDATELAYDQAQRPALTIPANPEELYNQPQPIGNFSKGLPHTLEGNVGPIAYEHFVKALREPNDLSKNGGFPAPLGPDPKLPGASHPDGYATEHDSVNEKTPVTELFYNDARDTEGGKKTGLRKWESPLGGLNSDISGPPVGGLSLPPAPALGSSELCAEIAEVYAMALLRDIEFSKLHIASTKISTSDSETVTIGDIHAELAALPWFNPEGTPVSSLRNATSFLTELTPQETRRRQARWDDDGQFSLKMLFRGSSAGAITGPYLSQFLLQGNSGQSDTGMISFGTQTINQRNRPDHAELDYMTGWHEWLDVQNGANFKGDRTEKPEAQFLTTLRDMAAYVHVDQLYQAYFNAALLILAEVDADTTPPMDLGLPNNMAHDKTTRQGFATWGGPHLLDLLASVSSRGLKVVRRQKFQIHRRARPEVIAARLALAHSERGDVLGTARPRVENMHKELFKYCPKLMNAVIARNASSVPPEHRGLDPNFDLPDAPIGRNGILLLPMAFPEGSPMHPAYGAGHATVAGACVTVLKALLNTVDKDHKPVSMSDFGFSDVKEGASQELASVASPALTLTGELDKLAANISIGRNMAGVHFYTDYFESLRMGERIAVGILQEHLQTSPEPVHLKLIDFDGRLVELKWKVDAASAHKAQIVVADGHIPTAEWWAENVLGYRVDVST